MCFKIFSTVLCVFVMINFSFSWSSTINTFLKSTNLFHSTMGINPLLIESVATGAQMAMDECKNVFKWDRWNCPQSSFSKKHNQAQTREKAYTDAVLAAGIIYSITRDCSQNVIKDCGCKSISAENEYKKLISHEKDWVWGGCSEDSSFGENLVLKLLEDRDQSTDAQSLVNRHNNKIGREIIREKMLKICKCHGVSGSCSMQTCWMQMPTFTEIAKQLRDRYDKAIMISFDSIQGALALGNSARHSGLEKTENLSENLIFLEESPDYCVSNNASGWPGTKGRTCSRTSSPTASFAEKKSCRNLCRTCGYRVRKQKKRVNVRCNCKFIWCCEVECQECIQDIEEFFCQ